MWTLFNLLLNPIGTLNNREYKTSCVAALTLGLLISVLWIMALQSKIILSLLLVLMAYMHFSIYGKRLAYHGQTRLWLLVVPALFYGLAWSVMQAWTSLSMDLQASQMITDVVIQQGGEPSGVYSQLKFIPAIVMGIMPVFITLVLCNMIVNLGARLLRSDVVSLK